MKKFKTIGILGGMGPFASAYFYKQMLVCCEQKYKAVQDNDFPQIIINSLALEGSDESGMEETPEIKKQLFDGMKSLENAGAEVIVIACISVHNIFNDLEKNVSIPVISIIKEVKKDVVKSKNKNILLISSETTQKYKIYEKEFKKTSINLIKSDKKLQKIVTDIIFGVMGRKDVSFLVNKVLKQIEYLHKTKKIDGVIIGCTELPLVIKQSQTNVKIYNSVEILINAAVKFAKN